MMMMINISTPRRVKKLTKNLLIQLEVRREQPIREPKKNLNVNNNES